MSIAIPHPVRMEGSMRVLWHGDGAVHTGFARVTHAIGERLVRDYGHMIEVLAINHRGDDFPSVLEPGKKSPLWFYRPTKHDGADIYGRSRILEMLGHGPDVVVMYNDPHIILHILEANPFDPGKVLSGWPLLTYVPCDGTNLPTYWQSLTKKTYMVSMSRYGSSMYPGTPFIYHGIDANEWWPVAERPIITSTGLRLKTKRDCKEAFGFDPDGFLVLRIDKNSGRKDIPATIKALEPFMRRHPEVQADIHTEKGGGSSGVNIEALLTRMTHIEGRRWFFPNMHDSFIGWPQEDMNALMNAADVFISTSRGEGFGLTLAEALACGVPVIAQNVSAIPEVVGPGGVLVEPFGLTTIPSGEDIWLPDIEAFTAALEDLYASPEKRRTLGERGIEHVRRHFDWDDAAKRFDKHLRTVESWATEKRRQFEERQAREALQAQEAPQEVAVV
jgi:glycosyltransferase involved in cell wall biosynthesis